MVGWILPTVSSLALSGYFSRPLKKKKVRKKKKESIFSNLFGSAFLVAVVCLLFLQVETRPRMHSSRVAIFGMTATFFGYLWTVLFFFFIAHDKEDCNTEIAHDVTLEFLRARV